MAIGALNVGNYKRLIATANVKADQGAILGFFVSSASTGTVAVYNSATTTTTDPILNTTSVAAATWYPLPAAFNNGLYVVISGTADITVIYI